MLNFKYHLLRLLYFQFRIYQFFSPASIRFQLKSLHSTNFQLIYLHILQSFDDVLNSPHNNT